MRPLQLKRLLASEFASASVGHHTPVMLWGAPGVGKSQIVATAAREQDMAVIDLRLSQMEPTDLRGIPFRDGAQVIWATPSLLPDAARHGARGVLFLDEINAAAPTVSAAAYQLILDRRLGDYCMPEGWVIVAAGNRHGDRGVTYTMPAPLANRFMHLEIDVNLDDWCEWAYSCGIDERVIGYLRYRPERLFEFDPARNAAAFPSPRSWEFAHRALKKFAAEPDLLAAALAACVGPAAGAEFNAFVRSAEHLPDLARILAGEEVELPSAIDLQYAVASALCARARSLADSRELDAGLANLLRLAERFPAREIGVMLVSDLFRAYRERLVALDAFAPWAESNADLLLHSG